MKLQLGKSTFTKKLHPKYAVGIPVNSGVTSTRLLPDLASQYSVTPSPSNEYFKIRKSVYFLVFKTHQELPVPLIANLMDFLGNAGRASSVIPGMNNFGEWMYNFAQGFREHVKLGPKFTETLKGKLRLGARILQVGGVEKVFKLNFNVCNGEKLLTASQCYLSTTAGPMAGLLFISTDKIAFCSERSIKLSSPTAKPLKIRYKVIVPLEKIKRANESENAKKPRQKYVQIVTEDKFEFWFMGFLNHQKAFKYLKQATVQTPSVTAVDARIISP